MMNKREQLDRGLFLVDLAEVSHELRKLGHSDLADEVNKDIEHMQLVWELSDKVDLNKLSNSASSRGLTKLASDVDFFVKEAGIMDTLMSGYQGIRGALGAKGFVAKIVAAYVSAKAQQFANAMRDKVIEQSKSIDGLGTMAVSKLPSVLWAAVKEIMPGFIQGLMGKLQGMMPGGGQQQPQP